MGGYILQLLLRRFGADRRLCTDLRVRRIEEEVGARWHEYYLLGEARSPWARFGPAIEMVMNLSIGSKVFAKRSSGIETEGTIMAYDASSKYPYMLAFSDGFTKQCDVSMLRVASGFEIGTMVYAKRKSGGETKGTVVSFDLTSQYPYTVALVDGFTKQCDPTMLRRVPLLTRHALWLLGSSCVCLTLLTCVCLAVITTCCGLQPPQHEQQPPALAAAEPPAMSLTSSGSSSGSSSSTSTSSSISRSTSNSIADDLLRLAIVPALSLGVLACLGYLGLFAACLCLRECGCRSSYTRALKAVPLIRVLFGYLYVACAARCHEEGSLCVPSSREWQILDEEQAAGDPILEFHNECKERLDTQARREAWNDRGAVTRDRGSGAPGIMSL